MIQRLRKLGAWGVSGLGDTLVDSMAASIQQMEGYIAPNAQYPNGSLAYQNNNPGNLRFANQPGATQGAGGFAKFPSYSAGYTALQNQIQGQISSGQNLTQFFNQYAPPSENNTTNYISTVAGQVGVDPTVPLSQYQSGAATIGSSTSSPSSTVASVASDSGDDPSSTSLIPSFYFSNLTSTLSTDFSSVSDAVTNADPTTLIAIGAGAIILIALFA